MLQVYSHCKQQHGGQCTSETLALVLQRLDALFLQSAAPALIRARAAASAVLAHLDTASESLLLAAVGHGAGVVGRLSGGLSMQQTEVQVFTASGSADTQQERPTYGLVGGGRHKLQQLSDAYCKQMGLEPAPVKLGASCKPIVSQQRLTAIDEHVILASTGLWQAVSPEDAALRCHFHLKGIAGVDGLLDGHAGGDQPTVTLNTARHIVAHAVSKRGGSRRQSCVVPNVTAVVITLRWPATSLNQAFSVHLKRQLQEGEPLCLDSPRGRALHRWGQIRSWLEYHRARRRMLLMKWRYTTQQVLVAGQQAARKLEERLWLEQHKAVRR
ncbi:hypothetical protein WJX72_012301 [[Myrmecia] bisecta]|uniref:PPM-type phosphatase domain-containing protein n=1 Tax=[Myrmecia] bisecta TaxID=41462 RepID=A0AAW1RB41_9CHLO